MSEPQIFHFLVMERFGYEPLCYPNRGRAFNATESKRSVTCMRCRKMLKLKQKRRQSAETETP